MVGGVGDIREVGWGLMMLLIEVLFFDVWDVMVWVGCFVFFLGVWGCGLGV